MSEETLGAYSAATFCTLVMRQNCQRHRKNDITIVSKADQKRSHRMTRADEERRREIQNGIKQKNIP